ncbi:MAG: Bax inhibitor-1 family protein [Planctomycetota bacterium]
MRANSPGAFGRISVPLTGSVAQADPLSRITFLRKVYALFGGAMAVWMGTSYLVATNEGLLNVAFGIMSFGIMGFIVLMAAMFFLLRLTASRGNAMSMFGLGAFGVLEGFLTAPLIYIASASQVASDALTSEQIHTLALNDTGSIVTQAFALTCAVFGGLSFYALTTKRDFSWMRGALWMGFFGLLAIGLLGMMGIGGGVSNWGYSMGFVILMGGFVLYDTQNILRRYPENMAASAAATLLIDFVIMFQHILMLLMRRN